MAAGGEVESKKGCFCLFSRRGNAVYMLTEKDPSEGKADAAGGGGLLQP